MVIESNYSINNFDKDQEAAAVRARYQEIEQRSGESTGGYDSLNPSLRSTEDSNQNHFNMVAAVEQSKSYERASSPVPSNMSAASTMVSQESGEVDHVKALLRRSVTAPGAPYGAPHSDVASNPGSVEENQSVASSNMSEYDHVNALLSRGSALRPNFARAPSVSDVRSEISDYPRSSLISLPPMQEEPQVGIFDSTLMSSGLEPLQAPPPLVNEDNNVTETPFDQVDKSSNPSQDFPPGFYLENSTKAQDVPAETNNMNSAPVEGSIFTVDSIEADLHQGYQDKINQVSNELNTSNLVPVEESHDEYIKDSKKDDASDGSSSVSLNSSSSSLEGKKLMEQTSSTVAPSDSITPTIKENEEAMVKELEEVEMDQKTRESVSSYHINSTLMVDEEQGVEMNDLSRFNGDDGQMSNEGEGEDLLKSEKADYEEMRNKKRRNFLIAGGVVLLLVIIGVIVGVVILVTGGDEEETTPTNPPDSGGDINPSAFQMGSAEFTSFGQAVSISSSGHRVAIVGQGSAKFVDIYSILSDNSTRSMELVGSVSKTDAANSAFEVSFSDAADILVLSTTSADSNFAQVYIPDSSNTTSWIPSGERIPAPADSVAPVAISRNGQHIAMSIVGTAVNVYHDLIDGPFLVGAAINSPEGSSLFGSSISFSSSGTTIAIGAQGSATVYIFKYDGTVWVEIGILQSEVTTDKFGASVAMNAAGDRLVVGAPNDAGVTGEFVDMGRCNVYEIKKNDDGTDTLKPLGESLFGIASGENFGAVVAISGAGDKIAVSSPGSDVVRVYRLALGETVSWEQINKDYKSEAGGFGDSMSLSADGNTLFVGAPGGTENNLYGSTYLYTINNDASQS